MAIQLDGIDYTLDTPIDNALNLLAYINQYMTDNDIRGSDGQIMQFTVNVASPMWLLILGLGYMFTIWQKLVYAAGQAFSIPDCSDPQLLNLAEIRMTSLLPGVKTVINGILTATGGVCSITTATKLLYEGIEFYPIMDYSTSSTVNIILASKDNGSFIVPANALTFETEPTNFGVLTTENSTPGRGPETIPELRRRLQIETRSIASIDLCKDAIAALIGIQSASILFNASLSLDMTIGSAVIPPRSAYILVQGFSDDIASIYCTYMTAPTPIGATTQNYITGSGQLIPVKFDQAQARSIYIKVIVEANTVPITYQDEIRDILLTVSGRLGIGVDYTQKYLINLFDTYTTVNILGLMVSMDNSTWGYTTAIEKYQIAVFAENNISFEII